MTIADKLVVTLLAEKGKKWEETQECIASYDGSIVFLPRDARAGDVVRVQLIPIGEKLDARGKVMYRTQPAPVFLPGNVKQQIAKEATWLRSCQVFKEPTALALLRAQYGTEFGAWKGYSHYFFEATGWVFGSHLPQATLYLYEQLATMAPQAMTEPLLWALDKNFFAFRAHGKELDWNTSIPQLTDEAVAELVKKVEAGEPVLSQALVRIVSGRIEIPALTDALWRSASWPTLPVPDVEQELPEELPGIVEHEFARDANGEPLIAYGALGLVESGTTCYATWGWYKTVNAAASVLQVSKVTLEQWKQTSSLREALLPRLEALVERRQVLGLSQPNSFGLIAFMLGREYKNYSIESVEEIAVETVKAEKAEADRVVAEKVKSTQTALEAALRLAEENAVALAAVQATAESKKQEADLQRREAAGGIIRPFRVWVHTSGQAGDAGAYVITKAGEIRLHDRDEYERSHSRGAHHQVWDLVVESDGVIEWSAGSSQQPRQPTLPVRKVPVGGWTEAQIETVKRLETELNVPFGKCWGLSLPEVIQDGKLASNEALDRLVNMFKKG